MQKVCILARVSTQIQDYDRQVNELTRYASSNGMEVVKVFANKISGAYSDEKGHMFQLKTDIFFN